MDGLIGFRQAKAAFFDRQAVTSEVDRRKLRALSKFGAYVWRGAKSSIRKRKKVSEPGKPPSSHTGVLREFIFFSYDSDSESVVVGPAKTNQVFFRGDGRPVTGTVPEALEEGGRVTILEVHRRGRWSRADLRSRRRIAGHPTRLRTVTIRPRPFMRPAFERELPKLAQFFRDAAH